MATDKELIENLGGPAKVAARLGYTVQRVQNWIARGIPAQVRLDHPDVFPLHLKPAEAPLQPGVEPGPDCSANASSTAQSN